MDLWRNYNMDEKIGGIWHELGISGGTAVIVLIVLYFVIKWAVKNGVKEAYKDITGKKTYDDIETDKFISELGLDDDESKED